MPPLTGLDGGEQNPKVRWTETEGRNTVTGVRLQSKLAGIILLLCLIPLTASANAGTALMWAGMLHLMFGNALIGFFEGIVLARFFKVSYDRCVLVMILANYISSWGGGLFLSGAIASHLSLDLYNAWFWFWVMVGVTYVLTLILELPFIFFCLRKEQNRFKKSLWGNLLINSASYLLLFGWYWCASGKGLYRNVNVVQPSQMTMPANGIVFFISATNGNVRSLDLATQKSEEVFALKSTDKDNRLLVKPSKFDTNNWDIIEHSKSVLIRSNLNVVATMTWRDSKGNSDAGTWSNFGEAPKLGAAENSDWTFRTGFWSVEGLRGKNSKTGEIIWASLETPFVSWIARSAIHLPGDYVVFQLGRDQICILETSTKKIALLSRGYGPVVILKK
jgi:hypothetical protein